MNNLLDNGAVLPYGLIGVDGDATLGAFRKTYQNYTLRVGIVTAYYGIKDFNNVNKAVPEYDVFVFEQNEDKGSTVITYKNCVAVSTFGSKADFLEAKLREFTKKTTKDTVISPSGQNGAIVLLLCLNGLSDTGIIVGSLLHPDRVTTLKDSEPHLEGEYNGVNIKVDSDGSATFTFKGATDNDGKITDPSQGPTVAQIEKDGSFQLKHSTITFRLDRNGTATLTTQKDVDLKVTGDVNVTASGKAVVNASEVNLNGSAGNILTTVSDPVIDTIFGIPTTGVPTVKAG